MTDQYFRNNIYQSLLNFATEEGINASGKDEIYGCIFGRDTAITVLKVLNACSRNKYYSDIKYDILLTICRRALMNITSLQGKEVNIESGEEPGKFIHEYRKDKYDHLLKLEKPWYVYSDGILRNYDSVDSTALTLIAIYRFWELTGDKEFIQATLPAVKKGLEWMLTYGDKDQDGLAEYELLPNRKYGGLPVQSWTDSHESLLRPDGTMPNYPIAPVEVQGYNWLAMKLWADFYAINSSYEDKNFSEFLQEKAQFTKKSFNEKFIFKDNGLYFVAQALDGDKNQIRTVTGNPLLLLWATYRKGEKRESILDSKYLPDVVSRVFQADMFDEDAGIRTMSTLSKTFDPTQNSYHNGSFWPKLNGMAHEGLVKWGFHKEAGDLKVATLKPLYYFKTPIELYIKDEKGTYLEFKGPTGQVSCREQAWSAAVMFDLLT